jgi:uncharacterized Fe-S radical SAM superfamily protein PflX
MAWTLRREGCHNINWVGGEVVIDLHAIVDAIALLGRDFAPTPAELRRARGTKGDRFFWFDEVSDNAVYDGKFNAPMLRNSNFFMTPESMKILRVLTDVWLPDFKFGTGISIDPRTRDIVQNVYIRKVEKVNGEPCAVEFATFEAVKDALKEAAAQ